MLSKLRDYASYLETEAENYKLRAKRDADSIGHAAEMHAYFACKNALEILYASFPQLKPNDSKE